MDAEYTNGNYYLGEIFEIALLSQSSGYIFHSYINISYRISKYVKKLCNVTDAIIHRQGQPFRRVINDLIRFIKQEEEEETEATDTIIVGHGSYTTDFPLLLVNCMKAKYDYTQFKKFTFIDSMQVFKDKGYKRPGLDALSGETDRLFHSATRDVELLRDIINRLSDDDITTTTKYVYNLEDIIHYVNMKLPISIQHLYKLAAHNVTSYQCFESELYSRVNEKTALNSKQVCKIACRYFTMYSFL